MTCAAHQRANVRWVRCPREIEVRRRAEGRLQALIHEYGKPLIGMYLGDQRLLTIADSRRGDSWKPSEPEANSTLWRYMSFAKFCSLLDRKALFFSLARIHRCGAALGLEQGVRAVGRDGPRSIPINGAGGGLWLSLGAPMAVLGSGAGAGSAGQHAGEDNRGPGRCDSVGRLGSLVDVSGAVGAVRQAMAGLAIEPARE